MLNTRELIAALQGDNDQQRAAALTACPELGAPAIQPIAELLAKDPTETRRAAKRGLEAIVHAAGQGGKLGQAAATAETELLSSLSKLDHVQARRELIWFLSELGGERSVAAVGKLLAHPELREDARCALERIPLPSAVTQLKAAFDQGPEAFKFALAESLRNRGVNVDGYPSQRLTPSKPTEVKPVA